MCDKDCFNCHYTDCIAEKMTLEEMQEQDNIDKQLERKAELEKDIDYRRRWELNNYERARANKHRHYVEHKAEYQARFKAYRENNHEKIKAGCKSYYERNREKILQQQREYRARKKAEREAQREKHITEK